MSESLAKQLAGKYAADPSEWMQIYYTVFLLPDTAALRDYIRILREG